jgi:hypothetical protein
VADRHALPLPSEGIQKRRFADAEVGRHVAQEPPYEIRRLRRVPAKRVPRTSPCMDGANKRIEHSRICM